MLKIGTFRILTDKEYEAMKDRLEKCDVACPLLTRLKELEPQQEKAQKQ